MSNESATQDMQTSLSDERLALQVANARAYIADLELAEPPAPLRALHAESLKGASDQGSAAIDNHGVTCFTGDISGTLKDDVLNSTLLAQLVADKKVPMPGGSVTYNVAAWYNAYVDTLKQIGWVVQSSDFSEHHVGGSTFTVQGVVIEILQAIVSGNEILLLTSALDALKKLENTSSNAATIWKSCVEEDSMGKFQLGTCTEQNGNATLSMGTFYLTGYTSQRHFLWVDMSSSDTHVQTATSGMVLNNAIYSQVRGAVAAKLGNHASSCIANLDI